MTTKRTRKPEDDDGEPCYVAKMSCGHYVAAVVADDYPETLKDVQEWRDRGLIVETKTVGFVRNGGLTFCKCATWERKLAASTA